MAETEKMLRTVLVMQAEILGRLEAIEQALASTGNPAEDWIRGTVGIGHAPVYGDTRLEALHEVDGLLQSDEWANVEAALNDLVKNVHQRSSPF
ncbi:hypothetical protein HOP60_09895 [Halomonas daqingensis]|uniref:Uncharacterized protein n=1 Tax=Billgrantia desiderata TaxID=52021 RepID=A0ABS9B4P6_9GAMM|nr:hypothetical protein [Halomonas desiderata]MCE8042465.1 hypothetical protein [Halomonas desiderata]MCE8047040.1 hypothetical protein [Halomonas desiderata]